MQGACLEHVDLAFVVGCVVGIGIGVSFFRFCGAELGAKIVLCTVVAYILVDIVAKAMASHTLYFSAVLESLFGFVGCGWCISFADGDIRDLFVGESRWVVFRW